MEVWTSIPCLASGPRSCSDMTIRIVDGTSSSVKNRKPSQTQTDATRTLALTSVQPSHSYVDFKCYDPPRTLSAKG